jgi:hypothetical protein
MGENGCQNANNTMKTHAIFYDNEMTRFEMPRFDGLIGRKKVEIRSNR